MRKFTGTVRFFVPYYCEVSATAKTKAAAEKKMVKTIKAELKKYGLEPGDYDRGDDIQAPEIYRAAKED